MGKVTYMWKEFFGAVLFYHAILFRFGEDFKFIQYGCVLCLLLCVIVSGDFFKPMNKKTSFLVSLFALAVLYTGVRGEYLYGRYSWHTGFLSSALLATQVVSVFGYIERIVYRKIQIKFLKYILCILGFYLLITDFYILYNIGNIVDDSSRIFVIGSKFIVSYYHLLFVALYGVVYSPHLLLTILQLIYCILISKIIYCSTGILGALAFVGFVSFKPFLKRILYNHFIFWLSICVCALFALLMESFRESDWFQNFLLALGESPSMSGRTLIYAQIYDSLLDSPWFGYGNGNGTTLSIYITDIGDAQNGILADVLDWGILGTMLLFYLAAQIIKSANFRERGFNLLCFLYLYVIMGMVEITLGVKFIAVLCLFFVAANVPHNANHLKYYHLKSKR